MKEKKELISNEIKKEIYEDGFKPALTETGKTLSFLPRVIKNAFAKVEKWCLNQEFMVEEFKTELERKLENKKLENIVDANPRIFIPAAQAISYSWDEKEIKELYLNLMASDMDCDTKNKIHPSFVAVIKQMDTTDVKLFTMLYKDIVLPVYQLSRKGEGGGFTNILDYLLPDDYYVIASETLIVKSLNNLERLKLIDISFEQSYTCKSNYSPIENGRVIKKYRSKCGESLEIGEGIIKKTEFGKDFYSACCE